MKHAFKSVCLIISLLILCSNLNGQDLESLERKYNLLSNMLMKEDSLLSVLKNSLGERASQIDYEKKKKDPDKNIITLLMSNSMNLSSQAEAQKKKVQNTFNELESVKRSLSITYGENLEKLQSRKKLSRNSLEISSIDSEILLLMGKRLAVMPYMPELSSDPGRIKSLDLSALNSKEKNIYSDYLWTALAETEAQLNQINIIYKETEQVIKLQKKTRKFLQEAELERGIHPAGRINNSAGLSSVVDRGNLKDGTVAAEKNTVDMIQSQALLYSQLNPEHSHEIMQSLKTILGTSGKRISLSGYFNMLKDLKQSLEEYRTMLLSKTGSSE